MLALAPRQDFPAHPPFPWDLWRRLTDLRPSLDAVVPGISPFLEHSLLNISLEKPCPKKEARQKLKEAFWIVATVLTWVILHWLNTYRNWTCFCRLGKLKTAFAHRIPSWSLNQYSQIRREAEMEVRTGVSRAVLDLMDISSLCGGLSTLGSSSVLKATESWVRKAKSCCFLAKD